MKKTLLIAVAAMFVAMGANAQRIAQSIKMQRAFENLKLEKTSTTKLSSSIVERHDKVSRRAEGVEGAWILNADNFDADFTESSLFTIESATGTITLDMYDKDEETGEFPTFEYNVILKDFTYSGATVYGFYDVEGAYILIPVQTIFVHPTYKEIVISGGHRSGANNVSYGSVLILDVNEDGTMEVDPNLEEGESEEDATTGWISFLPNYEDGNLWNYGFDLAIMQPNATMKYATTSDFFGGTGEGWANAEMRVCVEDFDSEWVVNNFLGLTPVSITLNEDGTCAIPLGIKVYDYDQEEPYGYFRLVGISIDGKYIVRNYEKTAFNGFYEPGYAEFFKTVYKEAWTDEDGTEHEAGNYFDDSDDNYCRYFAVATANDSDGKAYVLGYVCNMTIETDEHAETTGITELKNDGRQLTTSKTYNLLGQEVTPATKGLVIKDGRKVVVK